MQIKMKMDHFKYKIIRSNIFLKRNYFDSKEHDTVLDEGLYVLLEEETWNILKE